MTNLNTKKEEILFLAEHPMVKSLLGYIEQLEAGKIDTHTRTSSGEDSGRELSEQLKKSTTSSFLFKSEETLLLEEVVKSFNPEDEASITNKKLTVLNLMVGELVLTKNKQLREELLATMQLVASNLIRRARNSVAKGHFNSAKEELELANKINHEIGCGYLGVQ